MSIIAEDSERHLQEAAGSGASGLQPSDVYFPVVRCVILRRAIGVVPSSATLLSFPWHDFHCWDWTC